MFFFLKQFNKHCFYVFEICNYLLLMQIGMQSFVIELK